jgi:hypothetical protein
LAVSYWLERAGRLKKCGQKSQGAPLPVRACLMRESPEPGAKGQKPKAFEGLVAQVVRALH